LNGISRRNGVISSMRIAGESSIYGWVSQRTKAPFIGKIIDFLVGGLENRTLQLLGIPPKLIFKWILLIGGTCFPYIGTSNPN